MLSAIFRSTSFSKAPKMVKVTPSALVHVRVGLVAGLIGNGNNLIPCLILCHSLGIAGIFVQRARNGVIHTGTAVDRDRFRSGSTRKVRSGNTVGIQKCNYFDISFICSAYDNSCSGVP